MIKPPTVTVSRHNEQRFAFLKDPVFVDGIYLHKPSCIEALAYGLVIAGLVYSVFEWRVRDRLAEARERIQIPGDKWSQRPTGKMLLALMRNLSVTHGPGGAYRLSSPTHMVTRAARVAALADFDLDAPCTRQPASPGPSPTP